MILCEKCFKDYEVKAMIHETGKKGDCEVCNSKNINIYNTQKDIYLKEHFEALIDIYYVKSVLPNEYPTDHLRFVKEELKENWNIFSSSLDVYDIDNMIKEICSEKFIQEPEIFEEKVGIPQLAQKDYLQKHSIVGEYSWEDFVQSIMRKQRFHTNLFNTEVLKLFFPYIEKNYKKGTIFYRARVSDKAGYSIEKMGAPPDELATAGRANPEGISFLYLADSVETTLYEIRAGLFDYVSVGRFELKEDINVIDLTSIDGISAFSNFDFLTKHAINRDHLKKINNEIARPLRRNDSYLEYLPTQYICDYIKSIGIDGERKYQYQGIEYKSTMNDSGYNLAIFDEDLFECIDVNNYDVHKIKYWYDKT
ncbi:RES family NAD+ phosphorylase [Natranaerobius trueperi]|uniref:RES domain-containing protein n=1 Tax=Natranaerobius trueperi TaxID=759412 RepID=A0A226BUS1_9FIRM|nr:RES family NAD+ phosphorylase [Natranaerobius trueperi]OWZ82725.1 hypothetical protein CDO51_12505 [Natranaerobius trueperi]